MHFCDSLLVTKISFKNFVFLKSSIVCRHNWVTGLDAYFKFEQVIVQY